MTIDELTRIVSQIQRELVALQQLVRRHRHDDIETDKLPFSSFRDWGTNEQILTARGPSSPPEWNLPGVSPSASASVSRSPSASQSPSASLSPSSSVSPSP